MKLNWDGTSARRSPTHPLPSAWGRGDQKRAQHRYWRFGPVTEFLDGHTAQRLSTASGGSRHTGSRTRATHSSLLLSSFVSFVPWWFNPLRPVEKSGLPFRDPALGIRPALPLAWNADRGGSANVCKRSSPPSETLALSVDLTHVACEHDRSPCRDASAGGLRSLTIQCSRAQGGPPARGVRADEPTSDAGDFCCPAAIGLAWPRARATSPLLDASAGLLVGNLSGMQLGGGSG
jgi:hypothetical protein